MGKTPKPLRIVVIHPISKWEDFAAFKNQGHDVTEFFMEEVDLILGPTCWRMDEQHRKYLDLAISEARRRRYPPTKKEGA